MEEKEITVENMYDDYILINTNKAGCESSIGRKGGYQEIVAENCVKNGWTYLLHEVMHSIGL